MTDDIRITIHDPGCGWLTANDRPGWRKKARMEKAWRTAAGWAAIHAQLPRGITTPLHCTAYVHPSHLTRRRDPNNWNPTGKPVIDGLVSDYGLLPDDDSTHLTGPDFRLATPVARGQRVYLELVFTPQEQ